MFTEIFNLFIDCCKYKRARARIKFNDSALPFLQSAIHSDTYLQDELEALGKMVVDGEGKNIGSFTPTTSSIDIKDLKSKGKFVARNAQVTLMCFSYH